MPDAISSAWVEVLPDFSNFTRKANTEIVNSLSVAGDKGARAAGLSMKGVFGGSFFGNIAADAGRALVGGIATGIRTGFDFGLEGIDLASSLAEQSNAITVAFGPLSDSIAELAKNAPKDLLLTRSAFSKLAVRFSSAAKTIAGSGGNVAGVIDDLTTRGADFASVYDLEVSDALATFQSGLAGEAEPLRAFGVDLSDATIRAYAYANGIAAQGSALTEAQKVQARYGSLMAQTALVQGDLANTSGSLANQQRALAIGFEEAQTALGEYLLPGFTSLVGYANSTIIPKFGELIAIVGPQLSGAFEDNAPAIQAVIDKIIPLGEEVVDLGVEKLPLMIKAGNDLALAIPGWLDALDTLTDPDNPLDQFNAGLTSFADSINGENGLVNDLINGWSENDKVVMDYWNGTGIESATSYASGFGNGVVGSIPTVKFGANQVAGAARDALKVRIPDFGVVGGLAGQGFADGLSAKASAISIAAAAVGKGALTSLKRSLDEHSPSREMFKIGDMAGRGFELGLKASMPSIAANLPKIPKAPDFANGSDANLSQGSVATHTWNLHGLAPEVVQALIDRELNNVMAKVS